MYGILYELDPSIIANIYDIIEKKAAIVKGYNNDPSTTFRPFRPDDAMLQGTELVYDSTLATGGEAWIFAAAASIKVETSMGCVQVGWYCDAYLGPDSYFLTKVNSIKRNEVPAVLVYRQKTPPHLLLTPLQVVFAKQNESIEFKYYQETGEAIKCLAFPFGFVIGPAKQLLLE